MPRVTAARRKYILERSNRAVELSIEGKNLKQIAEVIATETRNPYYNRDCAQKDIDRALEATIKRTAINTDKLRQLEADRLLHYLNKLAGGINKGDVKAIDAATRIVDRRIRLLGLDQPIQVQIEQKVYQQLEVQFNMFFEAIANSAVIPDEYKEAIIEIAANLDNSAILAEQN